MHSRYSIQDIQLSLFKLKRAKGELLKDVSFQELTPEYRATLAAEARYIHSSTNITVRRVWRGKKKCWRNNQKVWRFIDKDLT